MDTDKTIQTVYAVKINPVLWEFSPATCSRTVHATSISFSCFELLHVCWVGLSTTISLMKTISSPCMYDDLRVYENVSLPNSEISIVILGPSFCSVILWELYACLTLD